MDALTNPKMMKEMLFPVLMSVGTFVPLSACVEPKADTADDTGTFDNDTGELPVTPNPLGSLKGERTLVKRECGWTSQEIPGYDPTRNCMPTSLLISKSCEEGILPTSEGLTDELDWMDENADEIGYYGSGGWPDYPGSNTTTRTLTAVAAGYFDFELQWYGGEKWKHHKPPVSLSVLFADVQQGFLPIVGVRAQDWCSEGDIMSDIMEANVTAHAMVLVGAIVHKHRAWVVVHDPAPYPEDERCGAFRKYTRRSFMRVWKESGYLSGRVGPGL